jgi:hypothetical protein
MFDGAAQGLEEIAPEYKSRNKVLDARVVLYMAAKKWDMAAAVVGHLVKVEPENAGNLAYSVRRRVVASPRRPPSPIKKIDNAWRTRIEQSRSSALCYINLIG